MIEVVAARPLRSGVVELRFARDVAVGFKLFECAQNSAPAGARFGNKSADRREAGIFLICLIGEQVENEFCYRRIDVKL